MVPRETPGLRPHRSRLAAMSAFGLVTGSLALALLPLAAFANTGKVFASENCQAWSAKVELDHNVISTHLVDVVLSPGFGQPGFVGRSFDTHAAKLGTTIWADSGNAPFVGTVTLVIHNPNGSVESTQSKSIAAPSTCHAPSITTALSASSITVPGTVHDSAMLTGATETASGTVAYNVYTDIACSLGARSAGTLSVTNHVVPDSSPVAFDSAATVYWQAAYSGDDNNSPAKSACSEETLVINKAADTVATKANAASGVVGTNGTFGDTATISSADQPSGNVSFGLYSDAACANAVTGVSGNGTIINGAASFSTTWTPSAAGVYYWKASYAGDANNKAFTECGGLNETVTVTDAPVTGTLGTTTTTTPTTPAGGGVQAASTTAPGLPTAGHPSLGLAPESSGSDLIRNLSVALLVLGLAGSAILVSRLIPSRGGKAQK